MIVLAGALAGAGYGAWLARRRKGTGADIAQYAAGFAIAFALLGFLLTLALGRLG